MQERTGSGVASEPTDECSSEMDYLGHGRNGEGMEFTVYFSTLRTEIESSSEMLGPIYQFTWRHIMDDSSICCLLIYQRPFISV